MMELNKIFAGVLVAGIIASLSGFLVKELMHKEHLKENAYKIEGVETIGSQGGSAKPKMPDPILAMLESADTIRGEKLSKACAACHSFTKGGNNGTGPNLWDIVNKKKAAVAGFSYSKAMKESGGDWNYLSLNKFLWKPKSYISGTKMNYIGLKKPEDRAAIIAWLRSLSDNPPALPSAAQINAELLELGSPVEE
jgi:cytochrome c